MILETSTHGVMCQMQILPLEERVLLESMKSAQLNGMCMIKFLKNALM